ncbi:MAG: hypothetical protein H6832_03765 [Planctomycetes bacterium]|nr:hypothetical protein [Planctomycetota bacterium]
MTSDEFENTQNGHEEDDLPIEEHDLNEDDYFVLEVEDEMSDVLDGDGEDDASSNFHETSDGFYATSSESGDEALFDDEFDGDANGEDLFADIDAAAAAEHIEAATEDVVDHEASFELDSSDDGEIFPGLCDEDEDADSRWQEEQERLESTPEQGDDDDFIESDLEDDFESARQSAPTAPTLPPPGYRPPVANPMDYGTISSSQLRGVPESGQHSAPDHFHVINKPSPEEQTDSFDHAAQERGAAPGSFEHDLLRSGGGDSFQQSSGNWAAVDNAEFHLVDHDADLESGNFSAVPPEDYEQPHVEPTRQAWAASPQNETQYGTEYAPEGQNYDSEHYAEQDYAQHGYDAQYDATNEGAEEYDPIYGAPRESEPVMAGGYQGQTGVRYGMAQDGSYDHLEEMVQDVVDDPSAEVIGGAPRHNRLARSFMTLTMAASVLVLGTVAFVTLRPDLPLAKKIRETLGLSVEDRPPLEVADAPRPKVDTTFVVPRLDAVAGGSLPDATTPDTGSNSGTGTTKDPFANISARSKERYAALRDFAQWAGRTSGMMALRYAASRSGTGTDRPTDGTRTTDPIASGDPSTKGDPGTKTDPNTTKTEPNDPIRGTDDVAKTPKTGTGSQSRDGTSETNPTQPQNGANDIAKLPDGAASDETQRKNPPSISGGPHGWGAGIMRGAQAFAQLQNGHFFVGRVQKVQEDELVMTWDQAEITFLPGDLQKLMPLASQEANILKGGPEGYVKLKNQNKIWGQILEDLPDVVTIQKGEHRIVIPKVAVAQVTKEKRAEIRLGKNDQDWSEDALPQVESDLPEVKVEPELQSGAIRVQLDTGTMKERSDHLRERIRRVFPVNPGR